MKLNHKRRMGQPLWAGAALLLVVLSGLYALLTYQACQEWKSLRSCLQAYANDNGKKVPIRQKASSMAVDQAIPLLIEAHELTLLSWQQSRQGKGQTLMMEGAFPNILSWLNDWQGQIPDGSCHIIEWVPDGEKTVITVEVNGSL